MFDIGKLLGINIPPEKVNKYLAEVIIRIDGIFEAWDRSAAAQERIAIAQERLADTYEKAIKINEKILEATERNGKEYRESLAKIFAPKK